ncbi:Altered inheritance of mitochondria protein 9, mitochondrial [Candida viswanathii]|uniref:Altered inheritance of mitochondria protein 9, mitochondrial n=1 Tax=Candida viswanathii TaxID=5486 RepID=A0A367XSB6_9ASCO|nr:Altered inheritance of mitochondria protein 9, mitochondrial [Candida viswanathii]
MLSRVIRNSTILRQLPKIRHPAVLPVIMKSPVRHYATDSLLDVVYSKLGETTDQQRQTLFEYNWGSWLKNDKLMKKQREVYFSLEGLASFINLIKDFEPGLSQPKPMHGSFVLTQNLDLIGESDRGVYFNLVTSLFQGKSDRLYKITLTTGKELLLRIPYKLTTDAALAAKIKSEVATADFLQLKLGLKVPRVLAYGTDTFNEVGSPYILEEFIPGQPLAAKWMAADSDPAEMDQDTESEKTMYDVLEPMVQFVDKAMGITFNQFGSLYFYNDVEGSLQNTVPYDGETDESLTNRWRIGPSVEAPFTKNKDKLPQKVIDEYNGPWDASNPLALIESVADIELENARNNLALINADAGASEDDKTLVTKQIEICEHFKKIAPRLLNPKSKSIMNVEDLFKPRLVFPKLDPMNFTEQEDGICYFGNFEVAVIKPFILANYPKFIAYNGERIYNLEEDVPGFNELSDLEKDAYREMYDRTKRETVWETLINKYRHDLIAVASPHIKVLRNPYLNALNVKSPREYYFIEGYIIYLLNKWETYVANELVNTTDKKFPVDFTEKDFEDNQANLRRIDHESQHPFAETGYWVPQTWLDAFIEQGAVVQNKDGDYEFVKQPLKLPRDSDQDESDKDQ